MRFFKVIILFYFFPFQCFSQIQIGVEPTLYASSIVKWYGVHPGGGLGFFLRYPIFRNDFGEDVFLEGGSSVSYLKGWYESGKLGNLILDEYENNFRTNFSLKIGSHFNFRNSHLLLKLGLEKYYLPEILNPDLFMFYYMQGEVFEIDFGFKLKSNKILNEITITGNSDISPLNFKQHGQKNKLLGITLSKIL